MSAHLCSIYLIDCRFKWLIQRDVVIITAGFSYDEETEALLRQRRHGEGQTKAAEKLLII
ncbi:hypothetical protein [Salsuginibacillus kocurii]|uniref:hypothetical protein n=1 Tax=Salsuginibacillus kocurii TaxID=427078 RepID=UPI0012EA2654|nr:hypothetical protein [Salsuginibacillus kocurii]